MPVPPHHDRPVPPRSEAEAAQRAAQARQAPLPVMSLGRLDEVLLAIPPEALDISAVSVRRCRDMKHMR